MAGGIFYNGAAQRGLLFNNVAQRACYYNNALVWTAVPDPITLYNGPAGFNGTTPLNFDSVYQNGYVTEFGGSWILAPWTNGDGNERRAACIRSQGMIDLTDFKYIKITYASKRGYGDAYQNDPRCTVYTSANGNARPFDWTDGVTSRWQNDTIYPNLVEHSIDISGVTGNNFVYVGNWSAGGANQVFVSKLILTGE